MSLHENTIRCFIHLLKTQLKLFSDEALTQLSNQLNDNDNDNELITAQPDDPKNLFDAICEWGEKYPDINAALLKLAESSKDRAPGTYKAHISIPEYPTTRQDIINVIQQSFTAKPPNTSPTNR